MKLVAEHLTASPPQNMQSCQAHALLLDLLGQLHVLTGLSKRILLGAEPGPWCQALGLTDLQVTKL